MAARKLMVRLAFFKESGKMYSTAQYFSTLPPSSLLSDFWDEVQQMRLSADSRTGLSSGGIGFYCYINVPIHRYAHPHLLLPCPAQIPPAPATNAPTAASGPVAGFLEHLHEADRDDSADENTPGLEHEESERWDGLS